ncbi:MAG: polysialyltransferase family glycosyltransferase [Sulfurimonas sp.]
MHHCIIMASTPLHLLDAIIIAKQFKKYQYHLFFIDQNTPDNEYFLSLQKWRKTPFTSVDIFTTDKSTLLKKIISKRHTIDQIFKKIQKLNPQKIIVGNDRKNEVSALISKMKNRVEFEYMDDGLHSYIAEKSSLLKYTFLDTIFKSLIYGTKIHTPEHIGTSHYIHAVYLYKPDLRHQYFNNTKVYGLDMNLLQTKDVKEWIELMIDHTGIDLKDEMLNIKSIIFLPHPKALTSFKLNSLMKLLKHQQGVAVKLHPRDYENAKKFSDIGIKVLNPKLSAELIFLSIPEEVRIFGFASTSLLMAAWLRPVLQIFSIQFEEAPFDEIEALMEKNRINMIPIDQIKF